MQEVQFRIAQCDVDSNFMRGVTCLMVVDLSEVQRPTLGELLVGCLLQSHSLRYGGELMTLAASILHQWSTYVYDHMRQGRGEAVLNYFSHRSLLKQRDLCGSGHYDWALARLREDRGLV